MPWVSGSFSLDENFFTAAINLLCQQEAPMEPAVGFVMICYKQEALTGPAEFRMQ
jgi:hypothetical protein